MQTSSRQAMTKRLQIATCATSSNVVCLFLSSRPHRRRCRPRSRLCHFAPPSFSVCCCCCHIHTRHKTRQTRLGRIMAMILTRYICCSSEIVNIHNGRTERLRWGAADAEPRRIEVEGREGGVVGANFHIIKSAQSTTSNQTTELVAGMMGNFSHVHSSHSFIEWKWMLNTQKEDCTREKEENYGFECKTIFPYSTGFHSWEIVHCTKCLTAPHTWQNPCVCLLSVYTFIFFSTLLSQHYMQSWGVIDSLNLSLRVMNNLNTHRQRSASMLIREIDQSRRDSQHDTL